MKYIKFNGIEFSCNTNFPFYNFEPNETSVSYQTDLALNSDGALFSNFRYNERAVALQGHIVGADETRLQEAKELLFAKCNGKTKATLFYFNGFKLYRAEAFSSVPALSEKRGLCYEFNINFTLPCFYWEEAEKTVFPLFKRNNEITENFTLPCVFTSRTTGNEIINDTDFDIFPTVEFLVNDTTDFNLIIKNETTGATIELENYSLTKNDKILIDTEKITAEKNGVSILNSFNDFTDFCLTAGRNEITVTNGGESLNASVFIYFNKKMIGV